MSQRSIWPILAVLVATLLPGVTPLLANANFDKAIQAARQGDWDEAAAAAQAAVNEDPKNAAAWSLLADAQTNIGDTTAAVSAYQRALGADAKYAGAVLGLTRVYLRQNKIDDANSVVSAAEEKDKKGKSDEIKVARGMVLARQGRFADARTILTSASQKNPKNALYPWILARIYEDQKVWDLAEENYAKAWQLDPGNATLAYEYGLVLQEQKKYNEALDLFKTVQETDPSNKAVDYLIGRLYFAAKRYGEAAQQLENAVSKRPDHYLSNLLLGRSYVELSRAEKKNFYSRAIAPLRKAIQLRPERQEARLALGEAILNQARAMLAIGQADTVKNATAYYDSALVMAREALAMDSTLPDAHGTIARAFDKKGMLDSAAFYQAIEVRLRPDDRNEFTRLVNIQQRNKKQAALVELLEPQMSDTAVLERFGLILVNAYSETDKYDRAKDLARQILARNPGNCQAHQTLAYIILKRERYGEAVQVLQQAVKSCGSDSDLWLQLGDSYYFSGPKKRANLESAQNAYQKACSLGAKDGCEKTDQVRQILAGPGLQ